MTKVEDFERVRPMLHSIAYRILGSVTEAEDAVQESWLRYEASPAEPVSPKAYLSAVITRISINVLRSARVRREEYVGPWFPEPLLDDQYQDPARSAELADSVSMAALVLLERLTPLERAAFVLHDVFGFEYRDVAAAIERSEATCRQHATRARRHMRAGRPRFDVDRRERTELADRFFDAFRDGDVERLRALLAENVAVIGDSGGKAPQWGSGVFGADNAARLLTRLGVPFMRIGGVVEPHKVNGQPGAIFRDHGGRVVNTWALDTAGGRIQTIHAVTNPDKLAHIGPVADASAVVRATIQAHSIADAAKESVK